MKKLWRILKRSLVVMLALVLALIVVGLTWYYANRLLIPDLAAAVKTDSIVTADLDDATLETVRQRISELRRDSGHPAVSVCVARAGKILWTEAQGYADLVDKRPATTQTRFPIGSVSKTLTAAAAMKLVERGDLDLDTDVREYVPKFPQKAHEFTVRQLLSHQAGIRHYRLAWAPPMFTEMGINTQYDSVIDSLELFAEDPLAFPPDSSFQYSTYGYTLVSAAVEKAAGEPFLEFMQTSVFEPLGMKHTRADDVTNKPAELATGYITTFDDSVLLAPSVNCSNKWGGGGFVSTPEDLVKFGVALLGDKVVSKSNRELMFQPSKKSDGKANKQNYGLGWRIGKMGFPEDSGQYVRIIHHGGTSIGAQAALLLVPESEIVVAICANSHVGGSGNLIQAAASLARDFMTE